MRNPFRDRALRLTCTFCDGNLQVEHHESYGHKAEVKVIVCTYRACEAEWDFYGQLVKGPKS